MSKPKIKKLGYPLWFDILFYSLTLLTPIILIFIEGLKAPNTKTGTVFKFTFTGLSIAIVVWFFIKKLIINRLETKLLAKQIALEHDYSIEVGNALKTKYLWYSNQRKLALYDFITVALYGGLIAIILLGVTSMLMSIKGVVIVTIVLYMIAYTVKFMLLTLKGVDEDEQE